MLTKAQRQYFERYAEPEANLALELFEQYFGDSKSQAFTNCLAIPCYDEELDFIESLDNAASNTLLVLCLNQPDHLDSINKNNQKALEQLLKGTQACLVRLENLYLVQYSAKLHILIIDRFTKPLPEKQGVGLARKIACDIAANLITHKRISSPWIYSSDADVQFPEGYFSIDAKPELSSYSALTLGFKHDDWKNELADSSVKLSTQLYEQSLQHYVDGLASAGSPYAFHTIGSCLVLNAEDYIRVRGFPKRAAGEDFYLLNKLNKLNGVSYTATPSIQIQSRVSMRVPFGTGPAVQAMLDGKQDWFYAPQCFTLLKQWLNLLDQIAAFKPVDSQSLPIYIDQCLHRLPTLLKELAEDLQLKKHSQQFHQQFNTAEQKLKAFCDWFDGFKTLKAIHFFTEVYPKQSSPTAPLPRDSA